MDDIDGKVNAVGKSVEKKIDMISTYLIRYFINMPTQLFEKGSRRNLKSYFGAFNMQWSFGSKSEPLTEIFVKIAFFKEYV